MPKHFTRATGSGYGACTCGWVSPHFAHGDDLCDALDAHDETHPEMVSTDCCDVLRPANETDVALDINGDVDVRVCRTGMGCLA